MNPRQTMTRNKVRLLASAMAIVLALTVSMFVRQWGGIDSVTNARPEIAPSEIVATSGDLDVAIQGPGYIAVALPDRPGVIGYTRFGALMVNAVGDLVVGIGKGYEIRWPINVGTDGRHVSIGSDGMVEVDQPGIKEKNAVGQILLAQFDHPEALTPIGNGIFIANSRTGEARMSYPGEDRAGRLLVGSLEQQTTPSRSQSQERK